jgi:hypothetical protein
MPSPENLPVQLSAKAREVACLYARIQWLEVQLASQMNKYDELEETYYNEIEYLEHEKTLLKYRCLGLARKLKE